METDETQDYVREGKSTEQEEEEERTFVPRQCSENTLSFWQLASVVDEGDEAYTTNLCQKCFNKHCQAKGEMPLSNVQWRQVVEKKAYHGRDVGK